jgi:hypothetical protein
MTQEDRRLIWTLIMTLSGVYVLLLPPLFAALAVGFSAYAAYRAME